MKYLCHPLGVAIAGVTVLTAGCCHSQKTSDVSTGNDWRTFERIADYRLFTYDLLHRLRASGRDQELISWGREVLAKEKKARSLGEDEVPGWLPTLDPSYGPPLMVLVIPSEAEGKGELRIYWGGGFGMWGITVSQADRIGADERTFLMRWERGLHVFYLLDP
jgi:hypothetical protein